MESVRVVFFWLDCRFSLGLGLMSCIVMTLVSSPHCDLLLNWMAWFCVSCYGAGVGWGLVNPVGEDHPSYPIIRFPMTKYEQHEMKRFGV